jgi:hypothetical protein
MTVSKHAQELLESTLRELFQAERSASKHPRSEAERLGQSPPGTMMEEIAVHAERSLEQLEDIARVRGFEPFGGALAAGRALSALRDQLADLAATTEQSYRVTLLGVRHSVDLVRLLRGLAVAADDRELQDWSERWSLRRLDLIEQAENALAWFAEHPAKALEPVKGTIVAQVARKMLRAVTGAESRLHL